MSLVQEHFENYENAELAATTRADRLGVDMHVIEIYDDPDQDIGELFLVDEGGRQLVEIYWGEDGYFVHFSTGPTMEAAA